MDVEKLIGYVSMLFRGLPIQDIANTINNLKRIIEQKFYFNKQHRPASGNGFIYCKINFYSESCITYLFTRFM